MNHLITNNNNSINHINTHDFISDYSLLSYECVQSMITAIHVSFDRTNISVPLVNCEQVHEQLMQDCKHVESNWVSTCWKRHDYNTHDGNRIALLETMYKARNKKNARCYLQLLQPTTDTLKYITTLIQTHVPEKACKSYNVCLNQMEIAWDFKASTLAQLYCIKGFIEHRLHIIHARSVSVRKYKGTTYIAHKGNIRKGSKGFRSYIKRKADGSYIYRLELQLNSRYLRDKKISFDSLANLTVDDFKLEDHVVLRDDFSLRGFWNIARNVLNKRGHETQDTRNYRLRTAVLANIYRNKVQGKERDKDGYFVDEEEVCIAVQKERFTQLRRHLGITTAFNYYSDEIDITEFIANKLVTGQDSVERLDIHGDTAVDDTGTGDALSFTTFTETGQIINGTHNYTDFFNNYADKLDITELINSRLIQQNNAENAENTGKMAVDDTGAGNTSSFIHRAETERYGFVHAGTTNTWIDRGSCITDRGS